MTVNVLQNYLGVVRFPKCISDIEIYKRNYKLLD